MINAEHTLRKLSVAAIDGGDYEVAAKLLALSSRLGVMAAEVEAGPIAAVDKPAAAVRNRFDAGKAASRRGAAVQYPRFERRGEDLTKIGWSRTDATEYEHAAPGWLLEATAAKLGSLPGKKRQFASGDLLAVGEEKGAPAYQVYVVLAWLRSLGLVEAVGRRGYVVAPGKQIGQEVREAWSSIERNDA